MDSRGSHGIVHGLVVDDINYYIVPTVSIGYEDVLFPEINRQSVESVASNALGSMEWLVGSSVRING